MRLLAICLPLVLLSSCTDDFEQYGVTLVDGEPAAVSAPCEGQDVVAVALIQTMEDVSPEDSPVLWRAEARPPRPVGFVTVIGDAPEGFETTIPLTTMLSEAREYSLFMEWYGGEASAVIIFRPNELRAGRIKTDIGDMLPPDRFVEYARGGGCDLAEGTEAAVGMLS